MKPVPKKVIPVTMNPEAEVEDWFGFLAVIFKQ
jgi:hypothetical protein